jgi:hypothetical protein
MRTQKYPSNVLPIAVSIPDAAQLISLSESKVDEAIRMGLLPVRRYGNRTLIRVSDLSAWIDSLPIGRPAAPPQLEGRRTGRPRKSMGVPPGESR